MDRDEFYDVLNDFVKQRLRGTPRETLLPIKGLGHMQTEMIMFHDFLIEWHRHILEDAMRNDKAAMGLINHMVSAWVTRAKFHRHFDDNMVVNIDLGAYKN